MEEVSMNCVKLASLLHEIVQKDTIMPTDHAAIRERVNREITLVEDEVIELVEANQEDIISHLTCIQNTQTAALAFSARSEHVSAHLKAIANSNALSALVENSRITEELEMQLAEEQQFLDHMRGIQKASALLKECQVNLQDLELGIAAIHLGEVHTLIESLPATSPGALSPALTHVTEQATAMRTNLAASLYSVATQMIVTAGGGEWRIAAELTGELQLSLVAVLEGLIALDSGHVVADLLFGFLFDSDTGLIPGVLRHDIDSHGGGGVVVQDDVELSVSVAGRSRQARGGTLTITAAETELTGDARCLGIHEMLTSTLTFLHKHLISDSSAVLQVLTAPGPQPGTTPHSHQEEMPASFWKRCCDVYKTHMLTLKHSPTHSARTAPSDLEMLCCDLGLNPSSRTDLSTFVESIDRHLCQSQRADLLAHVRSLLAERHLEQHHVTRMAPPALDGEADGAACAIFQFPECDVSVTGKSVCDLLQERAISAVSLENADSCKELLECVVDGFRACIPLSTLRASRLAQAAQPCLLAHNDLMLLAHTAQLISSAFSQRHADKCREVYAKFLALSPSFQSLARTIYSEQLALQLRSLSELRTEPLDGRSAQRLVHELHRVRSGWKVLPNHLYRISVSQVAEYGASILCEILLDKGDIAMDECDILRDSFAQLTAHIQSLVAADAEDSSAWIAMHVPSALRLGKLSDLLDARLADVPLLWANGQLVPLAQEEVIHMVQALFQDSPKRTAVIRELGLS